MSDADLGPDLLMFSLRARTAFSAAEEAFERALADPATNEIVVPEDGWTVLIGLAATYAALFAGSRSSVEIEELVTRAEQEFRTALGRVLTYSDREIAEECVVRGFTIRAEPKPILRPQI